MYIKSHCRILTTTFSYSTCLSWIIRTSWRLRIDIIVRWWWDVDLFIKNKNIMWFSISFFVHLFRSFDWQVENLTEVWLNGGGINEIKDFVLPCCSTSFFCSKMYWFSWKFRGLWTCWLVAWSIFNTTSTTYCTTKRHAGSYVKTTLRGLYCIYILGYSYSSVQSE